MDTREHWLFGAPKTSEQKLSEIEQVAEFVEWVVWRPALLLVRWPWWPAYLGFRNENHIRAQFSFAGEFAFRALCFVGLICELLLVWWLAIKPIASFWLALPPSEYSALTGVTFGACTLVRIVVYLYDELWNT